MADPLVLVVILNWNGGADTLACLESLSHVDYPSFQVVVIDNGSVDGSGDAIKAAYPEVNLVASPQNLGFAGGNNIGLELARWANASYVLLLNNDTLVAPDFLSLLVQCAEASPDIGVVGPVIRYAGKPDTIWSAGGAIDWVSGSTSMVGMDEKDVSQYGLLPRRVDFVTGCALLARVKAVEEAGPLDVHFFAYYEEAEWQLRIARKGYRTMVVPGAKIWHKITPERRAASPLVQYYMTRNRLLFLKLAGAGWKAWVHTLFFDYFRTWLSWSLRPKWRGMRAQRRALVDGISDYFSGAWGQAHRW